MQNLDSELLRTFIAIIDTGSISAGAVKFGRSQSAVSLQVNRLETILGSAVFERQSRGVILSEVGRKLEPVARRTVSLLDASLAELRSGDLAGSIRLGIPDNHTRTVLSDIIAEFSKTHPGVEINVQCASGAKFSNDIAEGRLDLALYEVDQPKDGLEALREEKTFWASSRMHAPEKKDPLPVALFDADCWWREAALKALRMSGLPFQIVYSSESVAGIVAAIEAGIAIGMLGETVVGQNIHQAKVPEPLQNMPVSKLVIDQRNTKNNKVADAMSQAIKLAFK